MASYHLENAAQQWYMQLHQEEGTPPWRRFAELLNFRFGPPVRACPLGELASCRRTGTVDAYTERFLELLPRAGPFSTDQKIPLFTLRLQEPLSIDVQLQHPVTLEVAMSLVRAYEHWEQTVAAAQASANRPPRSSRGLLPTPSTPQLPLPASSNSSSALCARCSSSSGRAIRRFSPEEMDERRRLGLCFNCDEKFARGHNRICKHIFFLELHDSESDNGNAEEPPTDNPVISLHAIAGVMASKTMQVPISLGTISIVALIDSVSTHNFISKSTTARTGLPVAQRGNMCIIVANGEKLSCLGVFRSAPFVIHISTFSANLIVLPLVGFDMVLRPSGSPCWGRSSGTSPRCPWRSDVKDDRWSGEDSQSHHDRACSQQ
jgi:hypothetical protein